MGEWVIVPVAAWSHREGKAPGFSTGWQTRIDAAGGLAKDAFSGLCPGFRRAATFAVAFAPQRLIRALLFPLRINAPRRQSTTDCPAAAGAGQRCADRSQRVSDS